MMALVILLALGGLMQAAQSSIGGDPSVLGVGQAEITFGFLLLIAAYAGRLVAKLRSPQLTGYLIAGVVAGPFVLGLVTVPMVRSLEMVKGVAVCLIALTAGGELSFKRIKPLIKTIKSMTLWAVVGTAIILTLTIFAMQSMLPFLDPMTMGQRFMMSMVLGVILTSMSPAVVMALINETNSDGPVSQTTLAMVVIADLIVILLYAVVAAVSSAMGVAAIGAEAAGHTVTFLQTVWHISWELFGSVLIGICIGLLLELFLARIERGIGLFVLVVCFVVAELGQAMQLDPLIVTLIAGVYLENFSRVDASKLIHDIEDASLPVYLVFFALAGASLDLVKLWAVIIPASILSVVRAGAFWGGCRIAAKKTKADAMVAKWTWVGLLPLAGLALALADIVDKRFGVGADAAVLILGVVAINQILGPIILRIALIRSGEADKRTSHGGAMGGPEACRAFVQEGLEALQNLLPEPVAAPEGALEPAKTKLYDLPHPKEESLGTGELPAFDEWPSPPNEPKDGSKE